MSEHSEAVIRAAATDPAFAGRNVVYYRTYVVLVEHADFDSEGNTADGRQRRAGWVLAKVKWLAGECGLSEASAGKHLAWLEEHRLLRLWRDSHGAARKAREYVIVRMADAATIAEAEQRAADRARRTEERREAADARRHTVGQERRPDGKFGPAIRTVSQHEVETADRTVSQHEVEPCTKRGSSRVPNAVRHRANPSDFNPSDFNPSDLTPTPPSAGAERGRGDGAGDAQRARMPYRVTWMTVISQGLALIGRKAPRRAVLLGHARVFKSIENRCGDEEAGNALCSALSSMQEVTEWPDGTCQNGQPTGAALREVGEGYLGAGEYPGDPDGPYWVARSGWLDDLWCPLGWEGRSLVCVDCDNGAQEEVANQ